MLSEETVTAFKEWCIENLGIKREEITKDIKYDADMNNYKIARKESCYNDAIHYHHLRRTEECIKNRRAITGISYNVGYKLLLQMHGKHLKTLCRVKDRRLWTRIMFAESQTEAKMLKIRLADSDQIVSDLYHNPSSTEINGQRIYYIFNRIYPEESAYFIDPFRFKNGKKLLKRKV